MPEEFTIECPACGTYYHHLEDEVCPFCGEPQPFIADYFESQPDEAYLQPPEAAEYPEEYAGQDYLEPEEIDQGPLLPPPPESDLYPDEAYLAPEEEPYPEEVPLPPEQATGDYYPEDYAEPHYPDDAYVPPHTDVPAYQGPGAGYPDSHPDSIQAGDHFYPDEFDDRDVYGADAAGYDDPDYPDHPDYYEEEAGTTPIPPPARRFTFRRVFLSCLSITLCGALFYSAIGILAVRSGLQERALIAQTESQMHYQRGQELLAENSIELAIAEFERAVKLSPTFIEARQALREAQHISQAQPTPTSQTRTAAAADIFDQAEAHFADEDWEATIQALIQVRDLDADYQPDQVSEMLYTANYEMGRQSLEAGQITDALAAFEAAQQEQSDAPEIVVAQSKASLYLRGTAAEADAQTAIRALSQLYREDPNYLDTAQQLRQAYEAFGDALADEGEWCLAEVQYNEAHELRTSGALQAKIDGSSERCGDTSVAQIRLATPEPERDTGAGPDATAVAESGSGSPDPTTPEAAADTPVAPGSGSILFSEFNRDELRWEILSVPAGGGAPQLVTTDGTMPAISPNGQIMLYHSERADSVGLHALDLTSGEIVRATTFAQHILPRWSGDNLQFIFSAQEPGTGRWQMWQGFADGKGDPVIVGDGRTPDWSPDSTTIAYQGTDLEGNNPGIYTRPFGGGTASRLTSHESDRSPAFSPDSSRVAFMSTQSGNWDIYVVSSGGGEPVQVTTAPGNEGLPAWSPDGSALAFVSDRGGSWGIHTVPLSGGTPTKAADWGMRNRADWLLSQIWWRP